MRSQKRSAAVVVASFAVLAAARSAAAQGPPAPAPPLVDLAAGSPTKGDWVGWVGRWQDIVEGRPGEYRVRLMKNHDGDDCAYPGLELLPDGTFVTTTYGHWTPGEPPYVVSVRFTLAELDARRGREP